MEYAYMSELALDGGIRQQRSGSSLQLSDDIRTRSIEKTLLPLLNQINTLVSSRAGSQSPATVQQQGGPLRPGSVAQQHAARVGLLVAAAADKFVTIGDSLAEEYPDAALEMREACNEVQTAALELRRVTDLSSKAQSGNQSRGGSPSRNSTMSPGAPESLAIVNTSRLLLSAITKVLLLADKLCVKQILTARDKVLFWLQELENVSRRPTAALAEFVATFSELGRALVELAHLSGDRQADLRRDKDRESLAVSRATLERGTQLLLAAAKTCLRHPESVAAARVRDSILRMMRQALHSVGQTLNDTISCGNAPTMGSQNNLVPQSDSDSSGATGDSGFPIGSSRDKGDNLPPLRDLVANVRSLVDGEAFSLGAGSAAICRLDTEVNRLSDALQDFTDCAYTPHASRERLLGLLDRLRSEANLIAEQAQTPQNQIPGESAESRNENIRVSVNRLADCITFLQSECNRTAEQLACAALESRATLPKTLTRGQISHSQPDVSDNTVDDYNTLINQLEFVALSGDQTAFRCTTASFEQRADLAIEAARLYRHIAPNECLQMDAEHVLAWLRLISAAISASAQVLFDQYPNPVSRVSRESFRSFATAWNDCTVRLLATLKERCNVANSHSLKNHGQSMVNNQQFDQAFTGGLFASPTSYSPPHIMSSFANVAGSSPGGLPPNHLSSAFCSAESLCNSATPPNGYRQSSLPRSAGRGNNLQSSPLNQPQMTVNRSPSSYNTPPQQSATLVRRSGSQPSLFDHLRQLRRHADNLSAMDGAVAAFSTGNGPLNSTADLMLQAQFVAEQARTICRLSTTAACQLPSTHGLRENVLAAVEKALAATGRLEAVLAMPPPVVPTAPLQNQHQAGITLKNERVIASCHAAVVAAGSVVNLLLQSSMALPAQALVQPTNLESTPPMNPPLFNQTVSLGQPEPNIQPRSFMSEYRNYAAPPPPPEAMLQNGASRIGGRRPWYSRSAANLAPNGAHPLSLGNGHQPQHRLI